MMLLLGPKGIEYEQFTHELFISKKMRPDQEVYSVAHEVDGELELLGYIHLDADSDRYENVLELLNSYKWEDHVVRRMLAQEDERASCSQCSKSFHENDVNLIDYEDDICTICELTYK